MKGSKPSSIFIFMLISLIIASLTILSQGLGTAEQVYAAPIITIGSGGDYINVTEAIINNALADGVTLMFVSDVHDYAGINIQWNITIDGGGYKWLIEESSPIAGVGVYLTSTPTHRTGIAIHNITILGMNNTVSGDALTTIFQGDAVEIEFINVTIGEYTSSDLYYIAMLLTYQDENFRLSLINTTILDSYVDSIQITARGNSYGEVVIDRFFGNTSNQFAGMFSITIRDNTIMNIYGSGLTLNGTYYAFYTHSYNNSRINFYVDRLVSRSVNVTLWFNLNTDGENYITLRDIDVYNARWGVIGNFYNNRVVFTMENTVFNQVASGISISYNGSRNAFNIRNITISNASFIGISISGFNTTDSYYNVQDIRGVDIRYACIYLSNVYSINQTTIVEDIDARGVYAGEGLRVSSYMNTYTRYTLSRISVRNSLVGINIQYINSTIGQLYLNNFYSTNISSAGRGMEATIVNSSGISMWMNTIDILEAGANEGIRILGVNGTGVRVSLTGLRISKPVNIGLAVEVRDSHGFNVDIDSAYISRSYSGVSWWTVNSLDTSLKMSNILIEDISQGAGTSITAINNLGNVSYILNNITIRDSGGSGIKGAVSGSTGDNWILKEIYIENVSKATILDSALSLLVLGPINTSITYEDIVIRDADKMGIMIYGSYPNGLDIAFDNITIINTGFIGFGHYLTNATGERIVVNNMRIMNSTGLGFGVLGVNGTDNQFQVTNLYIENVFDDQGAFPFVPFSNLGGVYIGPLAYNMTFIGRNIWITGNIVNTHMFINNSIFSENITISDSYIPGLKMINSTASFIDTYFDERNAELNNSILYVTWTLEVYLESNITNLPVAGASITLYNNSILMSSDSTNDNGITKLSLSYAINDTIRWIPGSIFEIIKDGENYTAYYILNTTLPSWYGIYNITIPIETFLIKAYGYSNDGLIGITVSNEEGVLIRIYPLDLLNPFSPRNRHYDIKVLEIKFYGRYIQIDILMNFETRTGDNWLPAKIFIDTEDRIIYIFGPIAGEVHY